MTIRLTALTVACALLLALGMVLRSLSLQHVAVLLHRWFPEVPERTATQLAAQMAGVQPPLLLDAREPEEFAVSRLPGAVRVAPDASPDHLVEALGARLKGRPVVVYCAVGGRSAVLTHRTRAALMAAGAADVAHLRGGLFGWRQAHLPLVDANGPTEQVHPYNRFWGRLLHR